MVAGSSNMPGAAMLASKAALRSGVGILRLYSRGDITLLPPEVIREKVSLEAIFEELPRTKALLVGPGLGREGEVKELLRKLYEKVRLPMVIDGDALFFFEGVNAPAVLTPHRGELCHLLEIKEPIDDLELIEKAVKFAKEKNVVLLCKGAPTTAISPDGRKIVIPYGNPGMASAGMGDALAGIILALLAQGLDTYSAAVMGAVIHGFAGDLAKEEKSSHGMTASDLIEFIPHIFL
jgi:NAD(P)H-hydrate epimerase